MQRRRDRQKELLQCIKERSYNSGCGEGEGRREKTTDKEYGENGSGEEKRVCKEGVQ